MRLLRLLAPCLALLPAAAQSPAHHVLSVGGAVDADGATRAVWTPDGGELLVLHTRSRDVSFLDGATLAVRGLAPVGAGARELEVTPDGRYALVADSADRTLTVVDVATRTTVAAVPLSGREPYGVEVASDSSFAVVASLGDATAPSSVSVVDLALLQETLHFPAPGQGILDPWEPDDPGVELVADDRTLLVPVLEPSRLDVYDVTTGAKLAGLSPPDPFQVPVVALADPTGTRAAVLCGDAFLMGWFEVLALDLASWTWTDAGLWGYELMPLRPSQAFVLTPDGAQALVLGDDALHFVDLATVKETALAGITGWAVAVTADGSTAAVANPYPVDTLATVDMATKTPTGAVLRTRTTRALAPHPLDRRVAALEAVHDEDVALVDTAGGGLALLARRPTGPGVEGDGPTAVAIDPTGTFAVTANERSDNLTVLDLGTRRASAWIPLHERPLDVALFDGGKTAVVWHADGDLSVVDVASETVLTRFPTGAPAFWLQYPVKQKRMVPFAADRVLLFAEPTAVTVEVNGAASRVLASHTVSSATWPEQPCTVSGSGVVAFPRSNLHEVHAVDAATLAPLYDLSTVLHPRVAVATPGDFLYVGGGTELQRIDVAGVPKKMGKVDVTGPREIRVDEAAGFAYLRSAEAHLVVVDVTAMQVVADLPLGDWAVAVELARPHVFVALEDGTLLRFLADGPNTRLLSSHPTRGAPVQIVVAPGGRAVLLVQRESDQVDLFEF